MLDARSLTAPEFRAGLAHIAGSYGRHAAPLDQRAREDRHRAQTGRLNRADGSAGAALDFLEPLSRGQRLGLTPRQRRRSDKKARRNGGIR